MIRGIESIALFSPNPKKLADFYRKIVGLTVTTEAEMGEEGMDLFEFAMKQGSSLYITYHSELKEKNRDPKRTMVNFEVDNIEKEVKRLVKAGAKRIQDTYHVEGYGKISTFEDVDGNYFQLVQIRPS